MGLILRGIADRKTALSAAAASGAVSALRASGTICTKRSGKGSRFILLLQTSAKEKKQHICIPSASVDGSETLFSLSDET